MEWKGVMPAITTKFNSSNKLDLDLFNKNLSFQIDSGVNAIVLAGSLGEASTLKQEEKNIWLGNGSFSQQWRQRLKHHLYW